jgi:hypothetical protein
VNSYEQKIKQIIDTVPFWEKDGGGIRGRTIAPLIGGASGPNLLGDPIPQQFNQQRSELIQQQEDPLPKLLLEEGGGGGGGECVGLSLYVKSTGGTNPQYQVWVSAGTVAGNLPLGFDPAEGKIIATGGEGDVWVEVNISQQDGSIVSTVVTGGGSTPENTDSSFYHTLGYYSYEDGLATVVNYECGGIEVRICRNWFAAEAPFYGVTLIR